MAVFLGIDLGTTGLKAVFVREDGAVVGSGYRGYPISIPHEGYAEQNPEDWWNALCEAVPEAMEAASLKPEEISGIGLSGQMHGTVLLNASGKSIYPAIIWCDQRSGKQVKALYERFGTDGLRKYTQNPVSTGFQAATLLWMRENEPCVYNAIKHVLLPKDYLRYRLTGLYGTEPTDACSTALFDCINHRWNEEMLHELAIDKSILPDECHSPTEIHGSLSAAAASALRLKPGIPVVFGGGDQPMQAVGNGILNMGDASITLGTGGQIFLPIDRPLCDHQLRTHTFCHVQPSTWYVMGAVLNCCLAQNWLFEKVLHSNDYARLHNEAENVPVGSRGLFFLPYLTGERTPHMNPNARGAYIGLTLGHDRAAIVRATLEGISYALKEALGCINALGVPIHRIILSGGGARSTLWRQIIADMMNKPVYLTSAIEEAGVGAAICAMVGTGYFPNPAEACRSVIKMKPDFIEPIAANVGFYEQNFKTFRELYLTNKQHFQSNAE